MFFFYEYSAGYPALLEIRYPPGNCNKKTQPRYPVKIPARIFSGAGFGAEAARSRLILLELCEHLSWTRSRPGYGK